jgi:PHD/YefM family antitoxin component YafN of YafNO toxin-antitoxin module
MTTPSAVFTELVSTTFRNHRTKLIDNVSNNNALLTYLKRKKKMRTESGGLEIAIPLEYAENGTYQRYSGYDLLNINQSDVITTAKYDWRQIALNVVASGRELRINNGKERIINLAKSRLKNAMNTFNNNFSADIYSDGALANQVGGLQHLVSDTGGGTVGGIVSTDWTFWKNVVQSAASPLQGGASITPGNGTIQSLMLPLWLELVRGNDKPDLIVSSNEYYSFYEESLTDLKRYTNSESANGGFVSLKYKSADVIFDGNSGIPDEHMYFLNTDYFEVVAHTDANLTVNDEMKPYNQDAVVIPILWMGNLTMSNRALQGVLKA